MASQKDQPLEDAGNAYELIRNRLKQQAQTLKTQVGTLNDQRTDMFGESELTIASNIRVRTENNCIARDIVSVGDVLVFGYNVFVGMRTETKVEDVFSTYRLDKSGDSAGLKQLAIGDSFLGDKQFQNDFQELYKYYKDSRLLQLRLVPGMLLAIFQTGSTFSDKRVFRWAIDADQNVKYLDDRGDKDSKLPANFDFKWHTVTRDYFVSGKHPHINIEDKVFVETIGGDLTVKIENNTETGEGIYAEPVDDPNQSLQDALVEYAIADKLILLKIKPYKETDTRYLVFNTINQQVHRIDQIGLACQKLPEEHGVIFPGGYYLQSGEHKVFDTEVEDMKFLDQVRSANGEDSLYVYFHEVDGRYVLLSYNIINKALANPIDCSGYSLFPTGELMCFKADKEPIRTHQIQVWNTSYVAAEEQPETTGDESLLATVGNAELVRAISDIRTVTRLVAEQAPRRGHYEELIKQIDSCNDAYFWLKDEEVGDLSGNLAQLRSTAEQVLDEFDKVEAVRQNSGKLLEEAKAIQTELVREIKYTSWDDIAGIVETLGRVRSQHGKLIGLKDLRFMDMSAVADMEAQINEQFELVSEKAVEFLLNPESMTPYTNAIEAVDASLNEITKKVELNEQLDKVDQISSDLSLLSEVINELEIKDANQRTDILERISAVFGQLNQIKAQCESKSQSLGAKEAALEFGAQLRLLSQNVSNAIGFCSTPEEADEASSRLLLQFEELEARFGDYDEFSLQLVEKREELLQTFETKKQQLLEERQSRAQSYSEAADRILAGVKRRAASYDDVDEINGFFVSDPMILKLHKLVESLRDIDETTRADDIAGKLKAANDEAIRTLRDKLEIFVEGGKVIQFGKHQFNVNTNDADLALVPKEDSFAIHVTGTDYFENLADDLVDQYSEYWKYTSSSENKGVYRAEYLAYQIYSAAQNGTDGLDNKKLHETKKTKEGLLPLVIEFASTRYEEGYERGVHDQDAAKILDTLISISDTAELLCYSPRARALAMLCWLNLVPRDERLVLESACRGQGLMRDTFGVEPESDELFNRIAKVMTEGAEEVFTDFDATEARMATDYLVDVLAKTEQAFYISGGAEALFRKIEKHLNDETARQIELEKAFLSLENKPALQYRLAFNWVSAYQQKFGQPEQGIDPAVSHEVAARLVGRDQVHWQVHQVKTRQTIEGIIGKHQSISEHQLSFELHEFLYRLKKHCDEYVPQYVAARDSRHQVIVDAKAELKLNELKPRAMTTFVRNKLIDEVFLPVIGDNLAKQMGAAGAKRRSDLMGMLLLISPPGYGKTTLMEYVASRLGLVFVKVNCPTIGHDVAAIDPNSAPNAAAKQELVKLNFALEMGNNVMLYLDDIQHTNPEFLQKFISLCDGQRKIEGVWRGKSKTYDLRGKKFCVVMAGNPYTESGEAFKIPDMLANRADIYNLGDMLSGHEEAFNLSYIENSMTSNGVLAPLASREKADYYKLIRMAQGDSVSADELAHNYSPGEINEIVAVLKHMLAVQSVLSKVNSAYIASAGQDDAYRTEPPFRLQGSYRNMNRLAEKVVAAMTDEELQAMITDDYRNESQTLTTGAEENMLKLAQLRGVQTEDEKARWAEIKQGYVRNQVLQDDDDPVNKAVGQLNEIAQGMKVLGESLQSKDPAAASQPIAEAIQQMSNAMASNVPQINVVNEQVPGLKILLETLAGTLEGSLLPVVKTMEHKLRLDHDIWDTLNDMVEKLKSIDAKTFEGVALDPKVRDPYVGETSHKKGEEND